MSFKDDYDFNLLINDAVDVVIEELDAQLSQEENKDVCHCQDCVLDMTAFALNQIRPSYRSTYTGVIYSQALYNDEKVHQTIVDAVHRAIKQISENPLHNL